MEYKELIRKVHPDLNPNLVDATQKAQLVNQNKNNPFQLRNFAIEWGFIEKPIGYRSTTTNNNTFYIFKVGDMITFRMGNTRKTGFIYKIQSNDYFVFDFDTGKCFKTSAPRGQEPFKFERTLGQMDFRYYYDKYIQYAETNEPIVPNMNYQNRNLFVVIYGKGHTHKYPLIKTTAKMVFYQDVDGKTRRSNLSKVFKIYKKRDNL